MNLGVNNGIKTMSGENVQAEWFFMRSGVQNGPVTEEALVQIFKDGRLTSDSLVWRHPMEDWQKAEKLKPFSDLLESISHETVVDEVVDDDPGGVQPEAEPEVITTSQVRPWTRYLARTVDGLFFGTFIALLGAAGIPVIAQLADYMFGLFATLLWVVIEPWFLSKWGATPGKWIMRTWVVGKEGKFLTYSEALVRSFWVLLRGLGMGLPGISIVTQVFAYQRLKTESITSWDKDGEWRVHHEEYGVIRIVMVIAMLVFYIYLASLGMMEQMDATGLLDAIE